MVRTFIASVVVWPTVASISLLASYFGFGLGSPVFYYIALPVGVVVNLLALLWAIRQALQQSYPQGNFRFVPHEPPTP